VTIGGGPGGISIPPSGGGRGGGSGQQQNPQQPPNNGTQTNQQKQQACLNQYNNSTYGKSVQFLSLYNLATNARDPKTWAEWTALPYAKVKVLGWISKISQAIGNTEFWSLTSGAATPAAQIVAPTAAGISAAESAGAVVGPIAIVGATAADIQMHAACAGYYDNQTVMLAPTVF
jgi:hypothetical protein